MSNPEPECNPNFYIVTPAPTVENPRDTRLSLGVIPPAMGKLSSYVYSIEFNSIYEYQEGLALVVAQDMREAFRLFRSALFMHHSNNYEFNFDCNEPLGLEAVKVFCAAETSQIGKVTFLLEE